MTKHVRTLFVFDLLLVASVVCLGVFVATLKVT